MGSSIVMTDPVPYYSVKAVRELDRLAIEQYRIAGYELMQRAAKATFIALYRTWSDVERLVIFCGTGKNGGDGFVLALLAIKAGLQVDIYLAGERSAIQGDALKAFTDALNSNVPIYPALPFPELDSSDNTVIVDALLGTGMRGREVRQPYRDVINHINKCGLPVVSVDIPSGVCGDTGEILGVSVKADLTVTFVGRKLGLIQGKGKTHCGRVVFDDLGIPSEAYAQVAAAKEIDGEE